jgi:hypothetical protein
MHPAFEHPDSARNLSTKRKSLNNMGEKLYNMLPNHFENLENIQLFRKKLYFFLLQQTIDEYWSYESLSWKM